MAVPFSILFMIVLPLAFLIFAWASVFGNLKVQ